MCIAAIALDAHPHWRIAVIANRDEFHARPSAPLSRWDDECGIIAGRDLQSGGTWLGVSDTGRLALVTNFRTPEGPQPGRLSRGDLVANWLMHATLPSIEIMEEYNPFNLLTADSASASILASRADPVVRRLGPGIHGLSNGLPTPAWPKTRRLVDRFADWLKSGDTDTASLFQALAARGPLGDPMADDAPVFIVNDVYGTRCSTIVLVDRDGRGTITERRFDPSGAATGETRIPFGQVA